MTGHGWEIKIIDDQGRLVREYKSLTEFALHLPLSTCRLKKLMGEKRTLSQKEYEAILIETFKPSISGARLGEKRRKKK